MQGTRVLEAETNKQLRCCNKLETYMKLFYVEQRTEMKLPWRSLEKPPHMLPVVLTIGVY